MQKTAIFSFLLLISNVATAQKAMSLKDCVNYGLTNDLSIRKTAMETDYINAQEKEAYSIVYPQVNGTVKYQNMLLIPKQLIDASTFNPTIPKGEQYQELQFGVANTFSFGTTVSQILYNHTVFLSVKAIREARALGLLGIERAREQSAFSIAQAYLNLLILRKQSKLLNVNLEKLDKSIPLLEATVAQGFAKPIDVVKLKVAKTNLQTELNNIGIADEQLMMVLKFAMNMPLEEEIALTDDVENLNLTAATKTETIDERLIKQQKTMLGIQNDVVYSGYYPSAAAFASGELQAQRAKIDFNDNLPWFPTAVVGLQINIPIFDGFNKKAKIQQGNIRIAQADFDRQNLVRALDLQTSQAKKKIQSLQNTLKTHQNNIDLANQVLTLTQEQQKLGFANSTDIIAAEGALREAQVNHLKTLADFKLAELDILKASGNLLNVLK